VITSLATGGSPSYSILGVESYSGASSTSPIDGPGTCATGFGTSLASGNYTVTTGDKNIGWAVSTGGGLTAASGWTDRQNATAADLIDQTAASGTANAQFTTTGSADFVAAGLAIQPSGGGGGGHCASCDLS
jgi:hypothetical protein